MQPPSSNLRTFGELATVGLSFVLAIVIGVAVGYWLDMTFGTRPWGFLVFFCFGVAAGILNVYRIMKRALK